MIEDESSTQPGFVLGALRCAPIALSVVPFGIIAAVSAGEAGFSTIKTALFSVIVFAGAAQLAALELTKNDAPSLVVIGAALIVNLRFAMYSASLAPHLRRAGRPLRALMSYMLSDQAFALSLPELEASPGRRSMRFYLGAAMALWSAWQVGTWMGILLGNAVPPELSLDFCVALAFVALAVPHMLSRPTLVAACVSVAVFVVAQGLPSGFPLLAAAAAGIAAGALTERCAPCPG